MKKQDLNSHFNEIIEKEANKFVNELPLNGNIIESIKPILRITFRKILFANLRILILIKAFEKMGNSKYPKLKKSLLICESHINAIWEEFYKILY